MREMEVCDGLRSLATMERIQLFRQLIEDNFRSTLLTIILPLFDALPPAKLSLVDLNCDGIYPLQRRRNTMLLHPSFGTCAAAIVVLFLALSAVDASIVCPGELSPGDFVWSDTNDDGVSHWSLARTTTPAFGRTDATHQWLDRTQQTQSFYQMPTCALSAELVVPSIPNPTRLQVWAGLATAGVWSTRRPCRTS